MTAHHVLALDVGTSSVRAMIGAFDGERLTLEENDRFYHMPVETPSGIYWNLPGIYQRLEELISGALMRRNAIQSLSLDAWGTDMVALDRSGDLITNGISTRDVRFRGAKEEFFRLIPRDEIYARTGIQFLDWNTLYLLYSLNREKPWLKDAAERWLFAPDCLLYLLTGERICDYTIASTSQMLNPESGKWDQQLVCAAGVHPASLGTPERGKLLGEARASGLQVYSGCSHDTAAAVAGTPIGGKDELYIIAGSWAMMGAELSEPVVSSAAQKCGFSNEGGVDGSIRFLKNSMGMWLIQESRREWARQGTEMSFGDLAAAGTEETPYRAIIDVNEPRLQSAGDVPGIIRELCAQSGQFVPQSAGEVVRVINDSLAFKFRIQLEEIERCTGRRYGTIHVVAGGSRDASLCQAIADVTGCRVLAGPSEASAYGNCMSQLICSGMVKDLSEARQVLRNSIHMREFLPCGSAEIEDLVARMRSSIQSTVSRTQNRERGGLK